MAPALLVLAAGLGSRYGGLKQLEPVGPNGELLLDYAVFDAMRAGFGRAVFIIRREFEDVFRETIGVRYAGQIKVDYVRQELDALPHGFKPPAGREKPWGTGHTVWCAREAISNNFAVINADDFYGADAFGQLAKFLVGRGVPAEPRLTEDGSPYPTFAMVGYKLGDTLSEYGTVSRGLSAVGSDELLQSITERSEITWANVGLGKELSGDEIVSMNCWGFTPAIFPALEAQFMNFLRAQRDDLKAEFYLPTAVSAMIAQNQAKVRVLPTSAAWFGVTYREDKPRVQSALAELARHGDYPSKLFNNA